MPRRGVTRRVASRSLFLQSLDVSETSLNRSGCDEPFLKIVGGRQFLSVEGASDAMAHELAPGNKHTGSLGLRLELAKSHRMEFVASWRVMTGRVGHALSVAGILAVGVVIPIQR